MKQYEVQGTITLTVNVTLHVSAKNYDQAQLRADAAFDKLTISEYEIKNGPDSMEWDEEGVEFEIEDIDELEDAK